jgi:Uncharacterized conserved protein
MTATPTPLPLEQEAPPLHQDASGVIRVGRTRVTLESVVSLFDQGASAEEIGLRYDVLDLRDINATMSYVLDHRDEVQVYLERARQRSARARSDAEQRSPMIEIRERLSRERTHKDDQPG